MTICDDAVARLLLAWCEPPTAKYESWYIQILYDWQTLATGILALIGAVLLGVQIYQQRDETRRQRRKEEIAARVLLPHALSDLHRYLEQMGKAWMTKDMTHRPQNFSDDHLKTIARSATVADKDTFETVRQLLVLLQAFESRVDDPEPINYYDNMIVDIARLLVLSNALYAFGRFKADSVPYVKPTRDALRLAVDQPLTLYALPPNDPIIMRLDEALQFVPER